MLQFKCLSKCPYFQYTLIKIYSRIAADLIHTAKEMKFSVKNFFSISEKNCEKRKPRVCSHLLKKSLTENFIVTRSSHPEVFCKKGVPRNFAKLTGKHLCQGLFFDKTCNFTKKETMAQVFSCKISKNNFC